MALAFDVLRNVLLRILFTSLSYRAIAQYSNTTHKTVANAARTLADHHVTKDNFHDFSDEDIRVMFYTVRGASANLVVPDFYLWRKRLTKKRVTHRSLWLEYAAANPGRYYSEGHLRKMYKEWAKENKITYKVFHAPGNSAQVDPAGDTTRLEKKVNGKQPKVYYFVGVLPCSGPVAVYAALSLGTEDFIKFQDFMFGYYGGTVEVVVNDNHKAAIIKPGVIPVLNRVYEAYAEHYSFIIHSCGVGEPTHKGAVEKAVQEVEKWIIEPLSRQKFYHIDEVNKALLPLLDKLNHRKTETYPDGRWALFEEIEKHALGPLPETKFEYFESTSKIKVRPDYHVKVDGHYYSVPYQHRNIQVEVRYTKDWVRILLDRKPIAEHKRSFVKGGFTTHNEHREEKDRAWANQSYEDYVNWAKDIGPSALDMVEIQFNRKSQQAHGGGSVECRRLKSLAYQYGKERFEQACEYAISIQLHKPDELSSILSSKSYEKKNDVAVNLNVPMHNNIRGAEYFSVNNHDS